MAASYYMKLYYEILDDRKMAKLPDRAWRRCLEIFLYAGELHQDGVLPPTEDIAWRLRVDEDDLAEDIELLESVGILAQYGEGWLVAKFAERQAPSGIYDQGYALHREEVYKRDGYQCVYCGGPPEHLDHVIPQSKGGGHDIRNLVTSCARCNLSKNNKDVKDWYPLQDFCSADRLRNIAYILSGENDDLCQVGAENE